MAADPACRDKLSSTTSPQQTVSSTSGEQYNYGGTLAGQQQQQHCR